MNQEVWEWDDDFTEEQWQSIIKPLENATVSVEDRNRIFMTGVIYLGNRRRSKTIVRPKQIAAFLEDVYKAAWRLRKAMGKADLDYEALPPRNYVTSEEWEQQKSDKLRSDTEALPWNLENWDDFIAKLGSLERSAKVKAQRWKAIQATPQNVKLARDQAWTILAQIYVRLTGERPKASPRTSKNGRYPKGYAGFIEAFMAALPGEKPVGDDELPNFLRTERYRERMRNFLDANNGLLKQQRTKRPLKRS